MYHQIFDQILFLFSVTQFGKCNLVEQINLNEIVMKISRNNIRHFQGIDPLATGSTLTGHQTHRRKLNLKTLVRLLKLQGRVGKPDELNARRLLRNDSDRSQGKNVVFGPADDQGVNVSGEIALSSCVPDRSVLGQAVVLVDNVIKQIKNVTFCSLFGTVLR